MLNVFTSWGFDNLREQISIFFYKKFFYETGKELRVRNYKLGESSEFVFHILF
jgi:hypothetical protein